MTATQQTPPTPRTPRRPRLRRSNCHRPGITRRGHGKGFVYRHADGTKVEVPEDLERIRGLAIPPAWKDVWISPQPNGHIQATGVDDAGRRQYIYHPRWRELKDREKFDRVLDFGDTLPRARPAVTRLLRAEGLTEEKACAAAFRLMDEAALRIGNEEYAQSNGSYGVTTLLVRHVRVDGDDVHLDFPGKSGHQWSLTLRDADLAAALAPMLERDPDEPALAYRDEDGQWATTTSARLNDFVRDRCGPDFTAKDFRTWQGTVSAALALAARADTRPSQSARKKAVSAAMREVAEHLGNTPTVARSSYVDPRVVDRFHHGETIDADTYRAAERNLRSFLT
ncbi:DNA topoisomerase IB [Kocuria sediminis]|uniref:DNA topoisomerase n=1 Tax=Kocuria sediminis TaxID=1038857 RepID=A0A6N8GPR9_9MICC|nr:DNA topoisomerase IB [Kocuria sediminis]MUN64290.1 DNA topoisomerase IB [Kocuria sediminis]